MILVGLRIIMFVFIIKILRIVRIILPFLKLPRYPSQFKITIPGGSADEMLKQYVAFNMKLNMFQCTVCNKTYTRKFALYSHLETVHFPKMIVYECEFCRQQFFNRNQKRLHMIRYHKDRKDFA